MYAIVAGGGKVGSNVTRSLLEMGHEVTMLEQRPARFARPDPSSVRVRGPRTTTRVAKPSG